jgi:two-component system, cell cycle sensor histidine kinase and response regulator CckA
MGTDSGVRTLASTGPTTETGPAPKPDWVSEVNQHHRRLRTFNRLILPVVCIGLGLLGVDFAFGSLVGHPAILSAVAVCVIVLGALRQHSVAAATNAIAAAERAIAAHADADRNRATVERSLRESEARLQAVISNSPGVAVQWYDPNGRVKLWNKASEAMFGFSEEEALGKTLDQLIWTPEEAQAFVEMFGSITESGCAVGPAEFSIRRKSGERGQCISTIFSIPGEGSTPWFVCMDVDITRLRKAEDALHQAQKLKAIGQLAGGIAHDFNNLLFVINGYAEFLLRELGPVERSPRRSAEGILEAGLRAAELTRQLLTFAQRQAVMPAIIDLHLELKALRSTLSELAGVRAGIGAAARVRVRLDLRAEHATIRIDPAQLQQIMMNLVVNARDAMPTGGDITIATESAESVSTDAGGVAGRALIRLTVTDTGTGMSPEVVERVFEPFFTTKGAGKGTGLGLATVYGAVHESGGDIQVRSEAGRGTCFSITWPVVKQPVTEAAPADDDASLGERSEAAPPPPATILLVEDEEPARKLVGRYLADCGYRVLEAADAFEAKRFIASDGYSIRLLITDVVMSEVGGRELADQLHACLPGVRVLFISGHTDDEVLRRGVMVAGDRFLQKPFSFDTLGTTVRAMLESINDRQR